MTKSKQRRILYAIDADDWEAATGEVLTTDHVVVQVVVNEQPRHKQLADAIRFALQQLKDTSGVYGDYNIQQEGIELGIDAAISTFEIVVKQFESR